MNKRLQDLRSCLSPKQHQRPALQNIDDEVVLVEGPVLPQSPRLFTLKIRCRADLVRLPVRTSDPLQNVVDHMANHLGVSPDRILLLFGETELSPTATLRTLKLGVADIIGEWKARKRGLVEILPWVAKFQRQDLLPVLLLPLSQSCFPQIVWC